MINSINSTHVIQNTSVVKSNNKANEEANESPSEKVAEAAGNKSSQIKSNHIIDSFA